MVEPSPLTSVASLLEVAAGQVAQADHAGGSRPAEGFRVGCVRREDGAASDDDRAVGVGGTGTLS